MDLFRQDVSWRIGPDEVLCKVDALMDWFHFLPILERVLGRSGVEPRGYDTNFD